MLKADMTIDSQNQIERLTAAGRGAVAVIRVCTGDAAAAIDNQFLAANGTLASNAARGRILFGKWGEEEIVVVRTADNEWEINCHGGEAAVQKIRHDLSSVTDEQAVERVQAGESVTESITGLLLQSRSRRTAEYLLAQQEGVFQQFLQSLVRCNDSAVAKALIDDCLKWQTFARHLTIPWKVTIAGRPNAGKSSLLNAVIGYERAIVFDQPGTTRDRIEAELLLDGWPMVVSDTAGIRETSDDIESSGVAASLSSVDSCDLCLLVIDSVTGWSDEDEAILQAVPADKPVAVLLNKTDIATDATFRVPNTDRTAKEFKVSATTGHGLNNVLTWVPSTLVPDAPPLTQPLPLLAEINWCLQQFCRDHDVSKLRSSLKKFD